MNEKIKEIAEFDGWNVPDSYEWAICTKDTNVQYLRNLPYLTDLKALHRVALDVMDRLMDLSEQIADKYENEPLNNTAKQASDLDRIERRINRILLAFRSRPINGEYTDLVDAVYDAIVYLKQHDQCQPK